jgi:hypothetical protein
MVLVPFIEGPSDGRSIVANGRCFYARRMTDASDEVNARVAAALKDAFAEVAQADIDGADKGRWQRRLLAITNTSKHDVARADEQLARYRDEWNMFRRGTEEAR